jgi:hypothetical protein
MKRLINATNITKFKKHFTVASDKTLWPTQGGVVVILLLGLGAALLQRPQAAPQETSSETVSSLDIFIPEGESLVPIQVANYESLDQVIGQFGVVDLLSTPLSPTEKAQRVAYAVKLIRSPESPRHFSVLIPADQAHRLAGHHGEFTVVVRNPKLVGTKIVKEKRGSQTRRIIYETENL